MPFGPDCEYSDFDDCVRRNQDKDDPEAYCGQLQRDTESQCNSMNESLSEKRRRAGRLGAQARWGSRGGVAITDGKSHGKYGNYGQIVNKSSAAADVLIYGELNRWDVSAKDFAAQLADINASTLNVYINSPGGSVFEGLAILNGLRRHPATVNTIVDGIAASAASFIAMAGDEIVMAPNSQLMIHDALALVDIIGMSNPADIDGMVAELQKLQGELERHSDNIASIYADVAGPRGGSDSVNDWRTLMREETWFFAEEAVEAGLADRVEGATSSATNKTTEPDEQSIERYFKYRSREDAPPPPRSVARSNRAPQPVNAPEVDLDFGDIAETLKGAFA